MTSKSTDRRPQAQTALVIHPVRPRDPSLRIPAARLAEATGLAQALDLDVRDGLITPLRATVPATLFGSGKVSEIEALCAGYEIDVVVVDDALSPVQQRNLERAWKVKVIDRTGMILEIFARRARTKEGKLQVELARLAYERSRLVRTWTHLERQRGGFGVMGGPGETQIESDRRLLDEKMIRLKKDIGEVGRTRGLQRQARRRVPYPTIALVGYTNAGKSTLFNRLTSATVVAKDMLFATLDPTLRQLKLPGGRPAILSDTVGFISDLPHELVDAFRATLDEVRDADVVLHVRDIAGPDSDAQDEDVRKVLAEIGIDRDSGKRVVEVWNKIDLLDAEQRPAVMERAQRQNAVAVSAATGEGIELLLKLIAGLVDEGPDLVFDLSSDDGEALAWLYRHGRVIAREEAAGRTIVAARLNAQALGQFERMRPTAHVQAAAE